MTTRILLLLILCIFCMGIAVAAPATKTDSVKTSAPLSKNRFKKRTLPNSAHHPQIAVKRSAIIPGYGQLYNGQWWKLPVIYAGLGALMGSAINNYHYYKQHLTVYRYYRNLTTVTKDMPEYRLYAGYRNTNITLNQLESAVNSAQRDTQFYCLCFAGAWSLQIIDAYIDAKFIHSYSMSPDLSIKIKPKLHWQPTSIDALNASMLTPMLCMSINF